MGTSAPTSAKPVAGMVFINISTAGPLGKTTDVPIHEVPLIRAWHGMVGSEVKILTDWTDAIPRVRYLTAEEYALERARLAERYARCVNGEQAIDQFTAVYGLGGERLPKVMKAMHDRYKEILGNGDEPTESEWEAIIRLAAAPGTEVEAIEVPGLDLDQASPEEDRTLDAELVERLKSRGIGARNARAVARLAATKVPTLADLLPVFAGNEDKAKQALKALEPALAG